LISEKIRREKVGSVPIFLLFARTNLAGGKWALGHTQLLCLVESNWKHASDATVGKL
jgi:hypothetical protein